MEPLHKEFYARFDKKIMDNIYPMVSGQLQAELRGQLWGQLVGQCNRTVGHLIVREF